MNLHVAGWIVYSRPGVNPFLFHFRNREPFSGRLSVQASPDRLVVPCLVPVTQQAKIARQPGGDQPAMNESPLMDQPASVSDIEPGRIVPLEGGRNFRDMGGYPGHGGRSVRWGTLFRSGSMVRLTAKDWESLRGRGVRTICDLRTPSEREHEPFAWADDPAIQYYARDYATSFAELRKTMASGYADAQSARAGMIAGYRELPWSQAPAYRRLFLHLAEGEVPLAFNCTAGKDRAGTAAALILAALGVPRTVIVEDYLLTNRSVDLKRILGGPTKGGGMAALPAGVTEAILIADAAYISAALDTVDEKHGSIEGYLLDALELETGHVARLRDHLLAIA